MATSPRTLARKPIVRGASLVLALSEPLAVGAVAAAPLTSTARPAFGSATPFILFAIAVSCHMKFDWNYREQKQSTRFLDRSQVSQASVILAIQHVASRAKRIGMNLIRTDPEYKAGMKLARNYLNRKGYSLPTESEMEYATRAGSSTPHHLVQGCLTQPRVLLAASRPSRARTRARRRKKCRCACRCRVGSASPARGAFTAKCRRLLRLRQPLHDVLLRLDLDAVLTWPPTRCNGSSRLLRGRRTASAATRNLRHAITLLAPAKLE